MARDVSPYALGATLYMPVVHQDAVAVALGKKRRGLRSVVLCLEDSLADADVDAGLAAVASIIAALSRVERDPLDTPLVFLRPRNLDMARRLAEWPGIDTFDGFVAPKVRPGRVSVWRDAVAGTDLRLMPTLETEEMFDHSAVRDLRDELKDCSDGRVVALRVGGNDLLSCLGLRRTRGTTLYQGPLLTVVSTLVGLLVPAGFKLTAPVFEILDEPDTFADELRRDVAWGFVGKTVVHPDQVAAVHAAFAVDPRDHVAALRILAADAAAVFKHDGAMCEPSTHKAWANAIVERERYYGLVPTMGPVLPDSLLSVLLPHEREPAEG